MTTLAQWFVQRDNQAFLLAKLAELRNVVEGSSVGVRPEEVHPGIKPILDVASEIVNEINEHVDE